MRIEILGYRVMYCMNGSGNNIINNIVNLQEKLKDSWLLMKNIG